MVSDNPAAPWPSSIVVNAYLALEGAGLWPSAGVTEGARGGKFILRNAFGPRVLRCGYTGGNSWWPGRVLLDGKDVTNVPTDFASHDKSNLELEFTQHPSSFKGTVVYPDGRPAAGAWVVFAAADPKQRQLWATTSKTAQADRNGTLRIPTLPGDYVAQAFPREAVSSRRNAWRLFASLDRNAITVRLGEREEKPIRLTLRSQH